MGPEEYQQRPTESDGQGSVAQARAPIAAHVPPAEAQPGQGCADRNSRGAEMQISSFTGYERGVHGTPLIIVIRGSLTRKVYSTSACKPLVLLSVRGGGRRRPKPFRRVGSSPYRLGKYG